MSEDKVYNDWQIERIESLTEKFVLAIFGGEVLIRSQSGCNVLTLFTFDGTREGFQQAYKEWRIAYESAKAKSISS